MQAEQQRDKTYMSGADKAYYKGAVPAFLMGGWVGGVAAGVLALSFPGTLALTGVLALSSAHWVGLKLSQRDQKVFTSPEIRKAWNTLFKAVFDLTHLQYEINTFDSSSLEFLSQNTFQWKQNPNRFHWQSYAAYQRIALLKRYAHYKREQPAIQEAAVQLKEAILRSSQRDKFQEWSHNSGEINVCEFLKKVKAVYPELVPEILNLRVDPDIQVYDGLSKKYADIFRATAPYVESHLKAMSSNIDKVAMMMATSLINFLLLEHDTQSQKISEKNHKDAVNETLKIFKQTVSVSKIYPFIELDKMQYVILLMIDPGSRKRIQTPCLHISHKTQEDIAALIKQIQALISQETSKDAINLPMYLEMLPSSVFSLLEYMGQEQPCNLSDALMPLIEENSQSALINFFSTEKNESKRQTVKHKIASIIKLAIFDMPLVDHNISIDLEFMSQCKTMGQEAGLKLEETMERTINIFSHLRFGKNRVTDIILNPVKPLWWASGYFTAWYCGSASTAQSAPEQTLAPGSSIESRQEQKNDKLLYS